ncbi:hypothetical protein TNCV_315511 [Trichonephila clavipes]|nr:hypothetical protein TNCV_315511 [Trichonephila clavipes]
MHARLELYKGVEAEVCPGLNYMEHLWDALELGVRSHRTARTILTKFWEAVANILQVIPMKRFQKLVEFMSRRVAAVIKDR